MSLSGILNSAATGLGASQTQIQVISNNIANVNTPGYAREIVTQASVTAASGGGVATGAISLAVDQFLRQTSLTATAQAGGAGPVRRPHGPERLFQPAQPDLRRLLHRGPEPGVLGVEEPDAEFDQQLPE